MKTRHVWVFLTIILISLLAPVAHADDPACAGTNNWAASMAFVHLKNAGLVNNQTIDFGKMDVKRIASDKIAKDLYRQVHLITFTEISGRKVEVITVSDASHEECSMGGVEVFVISRRLGSLNE